IGAVDLHIYEIVHAHTGIFERQLDRVKDLSGLLLRIVSGAFPTAGSTPRWPAPIPHAETRWSEFWSGSADREYGRLAGDPCGAAVLLALERLWFRKHRCRSQSSAGESGKA